jgi:hypothetical protein
VQSRANDDDNHAIMDFVLEVGKRLESEQPDHLILDLRFDTGGNCELNREPVRWIPVHGHGRIFVLEGSTVDRRSAKQAAF